MSRALPVFWIAACVAAAAAPQERTAEIQGRTLDAGTRQPVRGAIVWIGDGTRRPAIDDVSFGPPDIPGRPAPTTPSVRRFLTNADGQFILRGVAPGSAMITASKHGYFIGASGRRRPNGGAVPVVVAAGERITGIDVLMWQLASIAGTVTDERGRPIAGVSIVVSRKLDDAAPRQMGAIAGTGVTDDTGRYTVGGLGTGDYVAGVIVSHRAQPVGSPAYPGGSPAERAQSGLDPLQRFTSSPPQVLVGGRRLAYAGMFYGGVSDPSLAAAISLRDGEERVGVDLRLEPQPVVRIAGTVTDSSGPLARTALHLSSGSVTASAVSGAGGSFVVENVPAGVYDLAASPPSGSGAPVLVQGAPPVMTGIAANRDLDNVIVALGAGPTISGTLSAPADVDVDRVRVRLQHAGFESFTPAIPASRGGFALTAVRPGRYLIRIESGAPDVVLDAVEFRGRNVTDVPFDVAASDLSGFVLHITNRPSIVSGYVQRQDGKPSTNAGVALFPVDTAAWGAPLIPNSRQFQAKRVSGGGYLFENVPRGDYYLVAVDDALLRHWHDRSLLQKLMNQAVRITVAPGAELRRDLTVEEK